MARISGFLKRLFHRSTEETAEAPAIDAQTRNTRPQAPRAARPTQRNTDIPLDVLDRAYMPPVTSSKASFRSDGSDHQSDQELRTIADDRWNDEDRFTNKSGDPRIGTHRRSYEPGEARGETRE
ncbi:MAG TPA: hypothetical protein VJZ00_15040 [Thermoanaerobaculia bacterium]|nr:hypothetical protein [Thermoanaerobaculia bacterium]